MGPARSTRWVHLFVEGGEQYVFLGNLGTGAQSQAQRVRCIRPGCVIVRKVALNRLDSTQIKKKDPEDLALTHLEQQAERRRPGARPNFTHLIRTLDIPSPKSLSSDPDKFFRVSHSALYNGGDLQAFIEKCMDPRQRTSVPNGSWILHFLEQVGEALFFFQTCNPPVFHNDLHLGNILLHWEESSATPRFVIADFGLANQGSRRCRWDGRPVAADVQLLYGCAQRLTRISRISETALDSKLSEVLSWFQSIVFPPEDADVPIDQLSVLKQLLRLLPNPIEDSCQDSKDFWASVRPKEPVVSHSQYSTPADCLAAVNVHGPWHLAEVAINSATGEIAEVIDISERTYHRPNTYKSDSDTEPVARSLISWLRNLLI